MMDALGLARTRPSPVRARLRSSFGRGYYTEAVRGVWERLEEIDALIGRRRSTGGRKDDAGDRNILRLGAYELSLGSDIPFAVAINEASRSASGSAPGVRRVHQWILDRIADIVRKKTTAEGTA